MNPADTSIHSAQKAQQAICDLLVEGHGLLPSLLDRDNFPTVAWTRFLPPYSMSTIQRLPYIQIASISLTQMSHVSTVPKQHFSSFIA